MSKFARGVVSVAVSLAVMAGAGGAVAADPGVALVGKGLIPGTVLDKSGLSGDICQASNRGELRPRLDLRRIWLGHRIHRARRRLHRDPGSRPVRRADRCSLP